MASMSTGAAIKTKLNGGFFKDMLRKLFGGETMFINEFTVEDGQDKAELVLTQGTPGDIIAVGLKDSALFLQPGAFIACEPGVKFQLKWAGLRSGFLVKASFA